MTSRTKKIGLLIFIVLIIAGIISILLHNKAKIQEIAKSTEIITAFPVSVKQATNENLGVELSLVGTVYGDKEVTVLSETQGKIVTLYADVGTHLAAGSPIAKVDDEIKKATLMNAQANYEKTQKDYDRYKKLNSEKSVNDVQLEGSKLAYQIAESQYIIAKKQLSDTKIVAPFSGVVTSRLVEVGSVVGNNTPVAIIVDINNLKLKVNVAENDVFKLKVGDYVDITTAVYPGITFSGKIKNISSKGDDSHSYPVEIAIKNDRDCPMKSGIFATANFKTVKKTDVLTIPRDALVGSIKEPQVYVVQNGIARLRDIVVGVSAETKIEVLKGLETGETVVVNGQINLRDGSKVTIIEQGN